jgi:hypothetical protein
MHEYSAPAPAEIHLLPGVRWLHFPSRRDIGKIHLESVTMERSMARYLRLIFPGQEEYAAASAVPSADHPGARFSAEGGATSPMRPAVPTIFNRFTWEDR